MKKARVEGGSDYVVDGCLNCPYLRNAVQGWTCMHENMTFVCVVSATHVPDWCTLPEIDPVDKLLYEMGYVEVEKQVFRHPVKGMDTYINKIPKEP